MRQIIFLFALLISICATMALAKSEPKRGLLVTLDVQGERLQTVVTNPRTIDYVLSYVAGQAPRIDLAEAPHGARIVHVKDCRSGECVALRGLYAGRSPF